MQKKKSAKKNVRKKNQRKKECTKIIREKNCAPKEKQCTKNHEKICAQNLSSKKYTTQKNPLKNSLQKKSA